MKKESPEDRNIKMVKVVFRDPSFGINDSAVVYCLAAVVPGKIHETIDDFAQMFGFKTIQDYVSYLWPMAQNVEYDECTRSKCSFKSDTTEMTIEFQDIFFEKENCPHVMLSDTTATPAIVLDNDLINKVCIGFSPYTEGTHYTPNEIFEGTWNMGCHSIEKQKRKKRSL